MRAMVSIVVAAVLLNAGEALAVDASGCDQFAKVNAALAAPAADPVPAGAALPGGTAARLKLVAFAEAKLALAPERPPKFSPSYAGAFALDAPASSGVFKVALSSTGWIDLIQDGKFLKPVHFSDAAGCPPLRKVVEFRLAPAPATLQVTGVGRDEVSIVVSPE